MVLVSIAFAVLLRLIASATQGTVAFALYIGALALVSIAILFLILRVGAIATKFLISGIADRQGWAHEAVERCLGHGICPSCGYPLRGLNSEDDGRRVCPECSAAWKLNP